MSNDQPFNPTYEVRKQNLIRLSQEFSTQAEFARACKKAPTFIGDLLKGRKPIGNNVAKDIEKALGLNAGSLSYKDGDNIEKVPFGLVNFRQIPILDYVQAGCPNMSFDCFEGYIPVSIDAPSRAFALKVKGTSMEPDFREGDIIVVDPDSYPRSGDFVIARSNLENLGECTFKQFWPRGLNEKGKEYFELKPLNPRFQTMSSDEFLFEIIGVVIEHRRTKL